ncbi:hypothetical protein [Ruminococcus albus]|uniref:Uncharacterized protein n=1 Tax=Ruminococcus albus TaxID=1264 RepID=A0A1I1FD63_RUMAL|nr:hypothetical protein [Ruminococcus albus]SFB95648.1 hypothetical protein SAMN02910406_00904 [Ruminococcus albus]
MSKRRNIALSWIVATVFSLVIFCSSAFIIVHAEHDCGGEDCSVCLELAKLHKTLHELGTAVAGTIILALMTFIIAALCKITVCSRHAHITLISLKVELLD